MHHIAYEVDDVRSALVGLVREGAQLIDEEPHEGLFGLQVAFVHPESVHGVLTEVVVQWLMTGSGSRSASTAGRS